MSNGIRCRLSGIVILLVVMAVGMCGQAPKPDNQPISVHPKNPHYFLWKNKATVLVASGEHYGSVVNPDFDYKRYLATVSQVGLNHTRLFLGDYAEKEGDFGIADNPLAPAPGRFLAPWARSGVPGYALGGNKFDLDRWNPEYFERLHAFMREAANRNIVVEAVLFFVGPAWDELPLNQKNNINKTTAIDHLHYLSIDNGNILSRQEAYCRKLVRELNRYNNVIFNIANEPWFYNQERPGFVSQPPHATRQWIRRVSDWIADEESRLPKKHILSVDLSNQGTAISGEELKGDFARLSIFNVHYDANADSVTLNAAVPRIFAFNETGFNGLGDQHYRTQGWNYLLSGGGLYGNLDFSFTVGHEDGSSKPRFLTDAYDSGGSAALRGQLKVLLDFMDSIPFANMTPDNTFVVGGADQWRALAWEGHAYAIWFPGEGPIEPYISLPEGAWRFEWVDVLDGKVTTEVSREKQWVRRAHGTRRGGGVALRIFRDETSPAPAASGAREQFMGSNQQPLVLEDFESYASDAELAKQWYKPPHGSWMRQSLEPNLKAQGKYSLKYEYKLTAEKGQTYAAICEIKKWNLSGYNAVQFWLKPDGAGREVTVQFNIADAKGNNIHDLWEANYTTTVGDTAGQIVTIPFSQLHRPAWLEATGRSPVFNPNDVIELAIYIGAGTGKPGEGVLYFDDIKAVNMSTKTRSFSELADQALSTMRKRAGEVGITGVAVVAYFDGEEIQSWESKVTVVGKRKDLPSATDKGANLLAIAYAKASEAADSLKASGSAGRPLMTGEYGWPGSVIRKGRCGYWIAAFSGGKSEDDVAVSNAGLDSIVNVE